MEKTRDIIIWFAGFYEGEGCISNDISNNNKIRVSIAQNDRSPLDEGCSIWGGSVRERIRITAKGKECKGHEWKMSHHDSLNFIEDIRPFMRIPYKIQQMEQVIEKSKHRLDTRFKCHYCDKDYANPSARTRHEKQIHIQKNQTLVSNN